MTRHLLSLPLAGLVLLAGCNQPTLHFRIHPPLEYPETEFSAIRLTASIFMPARGFPVTCDNLAYADYSTEDLQATLVASLALEELSGTVGQVPRTGKKIVLVEGRGEALLRGGGTEEAVIVAGCSEIDEVTRPGPLDQQRVVEVQLERAARLLVTVTENNAEYPPSSLSASVSWERSTSAFPFLNISLVNHRLEQYGDIVDVRGRVYGPSGALLSEDRISYTDDRITYSAPVCFSGPFAVEVASRWGLGPTPLRIPGYSRLANVEAAPFGNAAIDWAQPLRVGHEDVGFVAQYQLEGNRHLGIARAIAFDGSTPPTFSTYAARFDLFGDPAALIYAGTAFVIDERIEGGRGSVVLVQPADIGAGGRLNPQNELIAVSIGRDNVIKTLNDIPLPRLADGQPEGVWTVPVGPCQGPPDDRVERDAAPIAISLVSFALVGEELRVDRARLLFANLGPGGGMASATPFETGDQIGNRFFDTHRAVVSSSHCVTDDEGNRHRLVVFLSIDSNDTTRLAVADFGPGLLDGTEITDLNNLTAEEAPDLVSTGNGVGEAGEPLLLATTLQEVSGDLEMFGVSSSGSPLLRPVRLLATELPASASYLGTGDLLAPGSRDLAALFVFWRRASDVRRSGFLTIMSQIFNPEANPVWGGYYLDQGVLAEETWMHIGRIGDASTDSILLVQPPIGGSGITTFEVSRLGEWLCPGQE